MIRNQKGITLVSLVITIVIMLILAGVSISLVVGQNGLFGKSKNAANQYKAAAANEANGLNAVDAELDSIATDNGLNF